MTIPDDRADNLRMIRESVAGLADRTDLGRVRGRRFHSEPLDRAMWAELADNGWLGLSAPEAAGGSGLGVIEYCAVAEALGAALFPEPVIPAVLAGRWVEGEDLAALIGGGRLLAPAWQEAFDGLDPCGGQVRVFEGALTGRKVLVASPRAADGFVVSTPDGQAVVSSDAPGLTLTVQTTVDGGEVGTLDFAATPVESVLPATEAMTAALDEAALATSSYLYGVADQAFRMTLDFLRTRRQFGVAIGSFQALQHRAVNLQLQLALTRATLDAAALAFELAPRSATARAAVSRAKARASATALLVTREAVQMHGAIGYTDEYDVGLFLRKAMVVSNNFGSASWHRRRFAEVSPTPVAA